MSEDAITEGVDVPWPIDELEDKEQWEIDESEESEDTEE